jgi:hypothetical protein
MSNISSYFKAKIQYSLIRYIFATLYGSVSARSILNYTVFPVCWFVVSAEVEDVSRLVTIGYYVGDIRLPFFRLKSLFLRVQSKKTRKKNTKSLRNSFIYNAAQRFSLPLKTLLNEDEEQNWYSAVFIE